MYNPVHLAPFCFDASSLNTFIAPLICGELKESQQGVVFCFEHYNLGLD
jgi:hypothetical protein